LTVGESQHIKEGELVAELDHRELNAMIEQSKAEQNEAAAEIDRLRKVVEQIESEVLAMRAPLKTLDAENEQYKVTKADAERRLTRDKKVSEKNAMPYSEVEDRITEVKAADAKIAWTDERKREAERRILVTEAQLSVARSAITVAEAREKTMASRVKVLESQLLDYFVNAPFDGIVTEKSAEVGEIIAPVSIGGTMARGSIITLADWNSLQAEVDVAETQIAKVKTNGRAAITVDAFPGKTYPGKVLRILPRANRSKATVQVRVGFLQRDDGVLPEMGVRVKFIPDDAPAGIETGEVKDHIVIPKTALLGTTGANYVWVISDSAAKRRSVTPGAAVGENIEITSGLAAGDVVVSQGAEKITEENQKVRVAE
jgi:HlyD family secretion protein